MEDLTARIGDALAKEEARAEQFANHVRLTLIILLAIVAVLNSPFVSIEANLLNFGALATGTAYGLMVFFRIRRLGYHPLMKYLTACADVVIVFLLLLLYTRIEIPSVALKNYVFLIVFPLIALTAFRYDRTLTLVAGGLALMLYCALVLSLYAAGSITFAYGGYERELFSNDVTSIGQLTKVLILGGYVLLMSHLAKYSRSLFVKLVGDEVTMQSQKEQTDWELTVASRVQQRFLPGSLPVVAGLDMYGEVQQGRSVGGDYYDFIRLAEDRLLVLTADVSGKGVPAALIMAEVRASSHLLASMHMGLEEFAQRLNSLVFQSTDSKSFVTFFAAEVDMSDRLLTYVIAGHPPPLVCTDGKVRSLERGTVPLGVCASLPQLTKRVEGFAPGSVLVAFTDGLLEHTSPEGEQFGEDRLRGYVLTNFHLAAESLTHSLMQEIRDFGEGKELNDDIGIAVVRHVTVL